MKVYLDLTHSLNKQVAEKHTKAGQTPDKQLLSAHNFVFKNLSTFLEIEKTKNKYVLMYEADNKNIIIEWLAMAARLAFIFQPSGTKRWTFSGPEQEEEGPLTDDKSKTEALMTEKLLLGKKIYQTQ